MQLVAYGAQDIYLTGNPQITFFKVVYRRHTNFSMETILQTLNGLGNTTSVDSTATATISRNGDLVHKVYVAFSTNGLTINGSDLVKEAELEIGGQRIDRHYQEWNEVWNELSTPESKAIGLKAMQFSIGGSGTGVGEAHVPLNFWFCRNPGLALPLIALQYHEVKIKLKFGAGGVSPNVWCDYIYLDTDERRRFAQVSHEYLIEQLQKEDKTGAVSGGNSKTHKLNFNHPVKELIWTTPADNTMSAIKLQLNGHDRFSEQPEEYFTLRQPFDYHTAVPRQNLPLVARTSVFDGLSLSNLTAASNGLLMGNNAASSITNTGVSFDGTILKIGTDAANPLAASSHIQTHGLVVGDLIALTCVTGAAQAGDGNEDSGVDGFLVSGAPLTVNIEMTPTTVMNGSTFVGVVATPTSPGASIVTITLKGPLVNTNSSALSTELRTITGLDANNGSGGAAASSFMISILKSNIASEARTSQLTKKIGVYSFALKPEEHQPSGTCNFSRIDNAQLIETSSANGPALTVYAVNYNVLRIMSGMGGLAYSN